MAEAPTKKCGRCKEEKPHASYGKRGGRQAGQLRSYCYPCEQEYGTVRRYGVNRAEYDRLWKEQKGACAICRVPFDIDKHKVAHIDHKHKKDKKKNHRGLLCMGCNVGLGHVKENRVTLLRMVSYLDEHSTEEELLEDQDVVYDELIRMIETMKIYRKQKAEEKKP
jgi:5-methylcytosine-specific restriction endonuclease McrA